MRIMLIFKKPYATDLLLKMTKKSKNSMRFCNCIQNQPIEMTPCSNLQTHIQPRKNQIWPLKCMTN